MGRPRLHDEKTRESLLVAAERLVAESGMDAVGVRPVAERAGTTTRAVYALFGSKEGLIQALAQHAYQVLSHRVDAVPLTADAGEDLVQAAVRGFRAFAVEHPDLFRLFFMASTVRPSLGAEAEQAAGAAFERLIQRVHRAHAAGVLGEHSPEEVTCLWDAICCGLAMREVCGLIEPVLAERLWTDGLRALLTGLSGAQSGDALQRSGPHGSHAASEPGPSL